MFATNLAKTPYPSLFVPQPQGLNYHGAAGNYEADIYNARFISTPQLFHKSHTFSETKIDEHANAVRFDSDSSTTLITQAIMNVRKHSLSFAKRGAKLWYGPHSYTSGLRDEYHELFSRPEFADLVTIYRGPRLTVAEYLKEMAKHKATLSPPGVAYDCFRTWEAMAVGTVPLVTKSADFDMRLFDNTAARFIPEPPQLTPKILADLLDSLEDPALSYDNITSKYWQAKWKAALS